MASVPGELSRGTGWGVGNMGKSSLGGPAPRGQGQSFLGAVSASADAIEQGAECDCTAGVSRPLRCRLRFAPSTQADRVSTILHLVRRGGPAAILRRVWTVVVDSIERQPRSCAIPRGEGPSNESLNVPPLLGYEDASPAVERPTRIVWIATASNHPSVGLAQVTAFSAEAVSEPSRLEAAHRSSRTRDRLLSCQPTAPNSRPERGVRDCAPRVLQPGTQGLRFTPRRQRDRVTTISNVLSR